MIQSVKADAEQAVDVIGLGDAQLMALSRQVEFQLIGDAGFDFGRAFSGHWASAEKCFVFHTFFLFMPIGEQLAESESESDGGTQKRSLCRNPQSTQKVALWSLTFSHKSLAKLFAAKTQPRVHTKYCGGLCSFFLA